MLRMLYNDLFATINWKICNDIFLVFKRINMYYIERDV
jgi:hypothetical protein